MNGDNANATVKKGGACINRRVILDGQVRKGVTYCNIVQSGGNIKSANQQRDHPSSNTGVHANLMGSGSSTRPGNAGRNESQEDETKHDDIIWRPNAMMEDFLETCAVGRVKKLEHIERVKKLCSVEGIGDCVVKYMGGLRIIIKFISSIMMNNVLNNENHGIRYWVKDLKKWKNERDAFNRLTWVSIVGMPIHGWEENAFIRVAERWGKVLETKNCSVWDSDSLVEGWVLLLTSHPDSINEWRSILIGDVRFQVKIVEDAFCVGNINMDSCHEDESEDSDVESQNYDGNSEDEPVKDSDDDVEVSEDVEPITQWDSDKDDEEKEYVKNDNFNEESDGTKKIDCSGMAGFCCLNGDNSVIGDSEVGEGEMVFLVNKKRVEKLNDGNHDDGKLRDQNFQSLKVGTTKSNVEAACSASSIIPESQKSNMGSKINVGPIDKDQVFLGQSGHIHEELIKKRNDILNKDIGPMGIIGPNGGASTVFNKGCGGTVPKETDYQTCGDSQIQDKGRKCNDKNRAKTKGSRQEGISGPSKKGEQQRFGVWEGRMSMRKIKELARAKKMKNKNGESVSTSNSLGGGGAKESKSSDKKSTSLTTKIKKVNNLEEVRSFGEKIGFRWDGKVEKGRATSDKKEQR